MSWIDQILGFKCCDCHCRIKGEKFRLNTGWVCSSVTFLKFDDTLESQSAEQSPFLNIA